MTKQQLNANLFNSIHFEPNFDKIAYSTSNNLSNSSFNLNSNSSSFNTNSNSNSNSTTNTNSKKSILKKSSASNLNENWQLKNRLELSSLQKNNNKYSSLADMYLDFTLNSIDQENVTRNDSICFLGYPDILENSSSRRFNIPEKPVEFYDDYEQNEDVISLNVDFSNDEELEIQNKTNEETETFKFELNPQKYTLELSTLSTSSSESLSKASSRSASPITRVSSTSSITYYDDFYISNKLNKAPIAKPKSTSTSYLAKNPEQEYPIYVNQWETLKNNSLIQRNFKQNLTDSLSSFSSLTSSSFEAKSKSKKQNFYQNDSGIVVVKKTNEFLNNTSNFYENLPQPIQEAQKLKLKEQQKHIQTLKLKKKTHLAMMQQETLQMSKNTSESFIDLLDDFLLIKIFSKLDTLDKLMLQFVCKRWHRIIWSNQYTYKLFKTIEITVDSLNTPQTHEPVIASKVNTSSKNSTFSRFFKSKKAKKSENEPPKLKILSISPANVNIDSVLKFLLTKLLNRQTYPLCLCVETVKIKNSTRITDRGVELVAKLCPELKHLSLRNCTSIKSNSIEKLVENCEELKYLDLTGCYNLTNIVVNLNKTKPTIIRSSEDSSQTLPSKTLNGLYKKFNSYLSTQNQELKKNRAKKSSFNEQKLGDFNVSSYLYLQFIDLSYCSNINDKCIENICKNCIFIKNLYLRRCKQLTDISVLYIAKYCLNLRELSLCQCARISDIGIRYLANDKLLNSASSSGLSKSVNNIDGDKTLKSKTPKFKYLSLAKCPLITDSSMIYLCKVGFFQHIKYLNLRGCTKITDKFIKNLVDTQSLSKLIQSQHTNKVDVSNLISKKRIYVPFELKSLDLAKCSITDKSIEYLCRLVATKPDILQRLSLRYCENITDEGIKLLAMNCKHLQNLNVTKCSKVTSQSLREIKKNCQSCVIQHTNFSFC